MPMKAATAISMTPKLTTKAPRKKPSSRSKHIPHRGHRGFIDSQLVNSFPPPHRGHRRNRPRSSIRTAPGRG
jgi:hypothetical protein